MNTLSQLCINCGGGLAGAGGCGPSAAGIASGVSDVEVSFLKEQVRSLTLKCDILATKKKQAQLKVSDSSMCVALVRTYVQC
jgi:hypothetical protein